MRDRRTLAEKHIARFPTCPIPRSLLSHALRSWRAQVHACFDTDGLNNGGTEAINMLIEKARRLAHGYRRNFEKYRLRMLLAATGNRTRRGRGRGLVTTLESEEP